MKSQLLVLAGLLLALLVNAQSNKEIVVSTKVETVKLFLNGAHVNRSATVNLPTGTTTIVFTDLPSTLDASTYQVEGVGEFTILSIKEGFSNKPNSLPKEAQLIKDSITVLLIKKEDVETLKSVLEEEEKFLNLNRQIGGQQNGVNAADLIAATEFYSKRLSEIKKGLLINRRKITDLSQQIERLKSRLYPYTSERVSLNQELTVSVMADRPTKAEIKVSYFTSAAQWIPMYDIRSTGSGNPVQLVLKASASNATGENWENVLFTYSTGRPTDNVNPPSIYPWYIRPVPPPPPPVSSKMRLNIINDEVDYDLKEESYELDEVVTAGFMSDFVNSSEAVTATDYSISIPYTLATGKDPLVVEIDRKELQAEFEYVAIPKMIPSVFLTAKIANAERLNLLSANASIFLNNAFTGSAFLSPEMATDTLTLPIGQDNAVTISRNRIKDLKAKNFFGGRVSETIGWEIVVRSLKSQPINIKVTDQIPLTTNKEIKVEVVDLSKGKLDQQSGIIIWNLTLDPGKSQNLKLVYKVEYPKEMRLVLE